ncbi:MAG: histidine phosphatase family protein [Bacteroidetes bacterium]|nr:histidine phosphatase family protein [Bacteroidota bacterium]
METTYYIVRHGETLGNTQKIIQGHTDTPLTGRGIEQAHIIREELSHINFSAVYSSDLGRAIHTAQIFINGSGLAHTTTPHLRERCFGKYESFPYSKMHEETEDLYKMLSSMPYEKRKTMKLEEDIECDEDLLVRFRKFIGETSEKYTGENVLVISHGGFMKVLLLEMMQEKYEYVMSGRFDNTGYIKLITANSRIDIAEINKFIPLE